MTQQKLHLTILTPLGPVCDAQVDQVTVTTTTGEISILANHIPIVSTLIIGQVMVRNGGDQSYYSITGGVLEKNQNNEVVILSSRSEAAQDIDIERAQEAYDKAQEMMKEAQQHPDMQDYNNVKEVLAKELNRVRVGQRGMRK